MIYIRLLIVIKLLLGFCGLTYAAESTSNPNPPLSAFVSKSKISGVKLSPSGNWIAFKSVAAGEPTLAVAATNLSDDVDSIQHGLESKHLSKIHDKKYNITWFEWIDDNWLIAGVEFPNLRYGVETTDTRLLKIERETGRSTLLLPPERGVAKSHYSQFQDHVISFLPQDPDHFIVSIDDEMPIYPTVYKVNIHSGKKSYIQHSDKPYRFWKVDRQGAVRIRVSQIVGKIERKFQYKNPHSGNWEDLWVCKNVKISCPRILGFDFDPSKLYVIKNSDGKQSLYRYTFGNQKLDIEHIHSVGYPEKFYALHYVVGLNRVVGIKGTKDYYWDKTFKNFIEKVNLAIPDRKNRIIGVSNDLKNYVVKSSNHNGYKQYYAGNNISNQIRAISSEPNHFSEISLKGKSEYSLSYEETPTFKVYLTKPWNTQTNLAPVVIILRDGMFANHHESVDLVTELFASLDYTVLEIDVDSFEHSSESGVVSDIEIYSQMLPRAIEHTINFAQTELGLRDEKRCIIGHGKAAHSALLSVTKERHKISCVVSISGVMNWEWLHKRAKYFVDSNRIKKSLGNRALFKDFSILKRTDSITSPILLIHGNNDRNVLVKHSIEMARALAKQDKNHELIVLESANHNFNNDNHRVKLFESIIRFLETHI